MGFERTNDRELTDGTTSFWYHKDGYLEIEINTERSHAIGFVEKKDVPVLIQWLKEKQEAHL